MSPTFPHGIGRTLVAGWFSFELMGASAGDLFARDVVCTWLKEQGRPYDIALAAPFSGGVDWAAVDPSTYDLVVFVCGPIGDGPPVNAFFERFQGRRMAGVNLTMLQPLTEWNPFDLLLERDSSRATRPDLVFLSSEPRVPVVGLALIDHQPEYARDRSAEVHDIIRRFLDTREAAVVSIDTRLDENRVGLRTPREIESLIAKMDVVITTRLHGTVLALKNGVPPLPVDAVEGGAKITRQVETLGWPVLLHADGLTTESLGEAFDFCLTPEAAREARACRDRAAQQLQSARLDFLHFLRR